MQEVCQKMPHMKGVYKGITREAYTKMLRNRISSLGSRLRRKGEEGQLNKLRELARRFYFLKKYDLVSEPILELLKIENDEKFAAMIRLVSRREDKKSSESSAGSMQNTSCKSTSKSKLTLLL